MNALRIAAERSISSLTDKVQSTEKYWKFRCVHDVSLLTPPIPWPQHQGRPGPALTGAAALSWLSEGASKLGGTVGAPHAVPGSRSGERAWG